MKTIKKKVYKFSEQSRMNQSKSAKSRWDAMTPEEQAAQIARLQAAKAAKKKTRQITKQPRLNLDSKQKEVVAKQNNPYVFNPSVTEQGSVVAPRTLALAKQEPEKPTPMQKNLEILRVRVGKRVGFEVNTEQAIEFLVNKWGVQGI